MSRLGTAGLLALCVVPTTAAVLRLTELATGRRITPDAPPHLGAPWPLAVHLVSVLGYSLLGAFQFVPELRRTGWHRRAGRGLAPAGVVAALSGLWLTLFAPLPADDEGLLEAFRLVVGPAMAGSIVLGVRAVRRGDIAAHRAWMTRGYALGMGAGTQAVLIAPITALAAAPTGGTRALLMGAGWAVNAVVAECLIHSSTRKDTR